MLTHLPLGDSGTRLQDTHCPGHHDVSKISLLVSWAWVSERRPWALLLTKRQTRTMLDIPTCQMHITSITDHQHTCKVQESTPDSQHGPSRVIKNQRLPLYSIIKIIIIIAKPLQVVCSPPKITSNFRPRVAYFQRQVNVPFVSVKIDRKNHFT